MKVLNIHTRTINQAKHVIVELFSKLSTKDDKVWPTEKWPRMKFKNGIGLAAKGGHGPIRYTVEKYDPENIIAFRFSKPNGFNGLHWLEINALNENQTEVKHVIDIDVSIWGGIQWLFAIRPLHDALLEDCLDKIENNACNSNKKSSYSIWVKILRKILS